MSDNDTVTCLAGLPYFIPLTHSCGHHVELHTVATPQKEDMEAAVAHPCPWCQIEAMRGRIPDDVVEYHLAQDHLHVPYRRGDAAFRRTTTSPADFVALYEMEKALGVLDAEAA